MWALECGVSTGSCDLRLVSQPTHVAARFEREPIPGSRGPAFLVAPFE